MRSGERRWTPSASHGDERWGRAVHHGGCFQTLKQGTGEKSPHSEVLFHGLRNKQSWIWAREEYRHHLRNTIGALSNHVTALTHAGRGLDEPAEMDV